MIPSLDQAYALPEAPYGDLVGGSFGRVSALIEAANASGCQLSQTSVSQTPASGMPFLLTEPSGMSGTMRGVRARLPATMGEGVWDFFELSDTLYLSLTDASYSSNIGLNLPLDDVVKLRVILEGELTCSFSRTRLQAGPGIYLSVHPGGHDNSYDIRRGTHLRMAVVHCKRSFFDDIITSFGDKSAFNSKFLLGEELIIHPLSRSLSELIAELTRPPYTGKLGDLYRDAKSLELFCSLLQLARPDAPAHDQATSIKNRATVSAARQLILENLSNPPTIEYLARELGLNSTKLKFLFRNAMGVPIFEFMQNERLNLASELLKNTIIPISEVAMRVGYSHSSNFTAAFKKRFGIPPSAMRRN